MAAASWFALSQDVPPGQGDYGSTFKSVQFKTTPERALSVARQYAQDNPRQHVQLFRGRGLAKLVWDSANEKPAPRSPVGSLPIVERHNIPRKLPVGVHQLNPGPSRPEWWPDPLP
jgi:hypothetical protein